MKKKIWKVLALIVAVALILGLGFIANALNGNPVSKMLAKRAAGVYLEENFPDTDYYIESIGFSFKFTGYYAHVRSESSMDTRFSLEIDMLGHVLWDSYEAVTSGSVTASRLEQEYRALTDQVFENPTFPYASDIQYGTLEIYPREAMEDPLVTDDPDYALIQEELILDHIYDPRALGAQAGHLVVYVDSDTITYEAAAEILLDLRARFDNANIPFRAIDFVLEAPLPEEGPRTEEDIRIENFPYEEITAEGLADRIAQAHAQLLAYYAEQDRK